MSVTVIAQTNLEALNTMLASIGEAPVSNYSTTSNLDATLARNTLEEVSREVQSEGWRFNTNLEEEFTPDGSNEITFGTDVARVDIVKHKHPNLDLVVRGLKLYDRKEHTYTITESVIYADVTRWLDWEDLPEPVRRFITIRASRIFAERRIGSETISRFTQRDEAMAKAKCKRDESLKGDFNILTNHPAIRR